MAYDRNYWQDHVTDQEGEVIQQGTLLDQTHFNRMEEGISDLSLAHALTAFKQMQESFDYEDELHTLDLEMNSLPWPFNNKETTVALQQARESINYSVEVNVLAFGGGNLGNVRVIERARNGFKLLHDGSATHVQVSVRVSGGMTDPALGDDEIEDFDEED